MFVKCFDNTLIYTYITCVRINGVRIRIKKFIRRACRQYLDKVEAEEMDIRYQQGYRRLPDDIGVAEAQILLIGKVLPEESW